MPSGRNNPIQWVAATLSSSCAIEAGRGVGRRISGAISAGMGGAGTWYRSGEQSGRKNGAHLLPQAAGSTPPAPGFPGLSAHLCKHH